MHALVAGRMEQITRDVNNGEVYLTVTHGYRPMYYQYMHSIGWTAQPDAKGRVSIKKDLEFEGDRVMCVDLRTYVTIWKRDHPLLKLNKRAEEICGNLRTSRTCHRYPPPFCSISAGDGHASK